MKIILRWIHILVDPFFTVYIICWLGIVVSRYTGMPIAMLNSYLTDFLFIPVVAHISLTTVRVLFKKGATYRYALLPLLVAASVTAGVMELALPKISADYVFDVGDIFAYFSGALFFYYVHQRHVY